MPHVIYEMGVSADGYIAGPDGTFDWATPDEELHRFHNARARTLAGHLLGRRLYETMVYWETADDPSDVSRSSRRSGRRCPRWCSRGHSTRSWERTRSSRAMTCAPS